MTISRSYSRVASLVFPFTVATLGWYVYADATRSTASAPRASRPEGSATTSSSEAPGPALSQVFGRIYATGEQWGRNDAGEGSSGPGSTLGATVVYRAFLQSFLKEHGIRSVVDAGCGDWEFSQAIDWSGIDYTGLDIVPAVVAKDTAKYGAPNIHFRVANMVEDELPDADLLVSKDVLQHLPNQDIARFLRKITKYKHVLLVNGVDSSTLSSDNRDIPAGYYRPLDLTRPPFSLPGAKVLTYFDGSHTHQVLHLTRP